MAASKPSPALSGGATVPPRRRAPALTVVPIDPERSSARPEDPWARDLRAIAESQDRDAFARVFAHFAPRVKRFLMHRGAREVHAEELAQETLAAVWRKATLFDPTLAMAATWIFTIARNLRTDQLRRRQGFEPSDEAFDFDSLAAGEPPAEERLDTARLNERLRMALAQLPAERLQVLRLSYLDDESHSRIATELGIPLGTVKSRVRLAVAQLRRLLES